MPLHYALTPANAQDASPWNKWSRTVYFPRQNRWKKRRSEIEKIPRRSTRNCTPPPTKKEANSFKEMPTANEPMFANLFGSTTPGPIVHYLPEVRSLFPVDVWRDTLRTLPDCDFVNELLHDIKILILAFVLVLIMIVPLEFLKSPFLNHRNWNANCSQQKGRALPCTFSNFVCSPMGAIPKKQSHPPKWYIINDLSWPAGQSVNDEISNLLPWIVGSQCSQWANSIFQTPSVIYCRPSWLTLCPTVLRVLVISSTCSLRLVSGVRRRRYFLNLLTVCPMGWRSVALTPFGTTSMIFWHVPLPPKRRFLFES